MGNWKILISDQIRDQFTCPLSRSFKHSLDSCIINSKLPYLSSENAATLLSLSGTALKVIGSSSNSNFEEKRLNRNSTLSTLRHKSLIDSAPNSFVNQPLNPWLNPKNFSNMNFSLYAKRDEQIELIDTNFTVPSGSPPFQITLLIRMLYTIAMYGIMGLTAKVICDLSHIPFASGLEFDMKSILLGCLFSLPPAFFVLLLQQDFCTQRFAPALAIKDVEKEEVMDFFYGMKPWQYIFICSIAGISEELFFRCAIQGSLFYFMQSSGREISNNAIGMAALVGFLPSLVPCSKAFSAILTATIKGSIFYVISAPKRSILLLPRMKSQSELNKRIEAWYQHEELKKIYSPLLESLISLYIGFEWIYAGNLVSPIITHALYSISLVSYSIMKIEEENDELRERVLSIMNEYKYVPKMNKKLPNDLLSSIDKGEE